MAGNKSLEASNFGATKNGVRQMKLKCRTPFLCCLICLPVAGAWSMDVPERRVAAIIASGHESMVLVEDSAGKQNWHRVGDLVGDSRVKHIDPNWIRLSTPDGEVRMYLRGDKYQESPVQPTVSAEQPPRETSRDYRFVNLISRVDSAAPGSGAVSAQDSTSRLNAIFDLAERARITSINHVEVANVAEASAELRNQLLHDGPIRITVENAYTKVLYLMPE